MNIELGPCSVSYGPYCEMIKKVSSFISGHIPFQCLTWSPPFYIPFHSFYSLIREADDIMLYERYDEEI